MTKVVFGDDLLRGSTQDRVEKRQREGINKFIWGFRGCTE